MFVVTTESRVVMANDRLTFPVCWELPDGERLGELDALITTSGFVVSERVPSGFVLKATQQWHAEPGGNEHAFGYTFGVNGAKREPARILSGPVGVRVFRRLMKSPSPMETFTDLINQGLVNYSTHAPARPLELAFQRIKFQVRLVCGTPLSYPTITSGNNVRWPRLDRYTALYSWVRETRRYDASIRLTPHVLRSNASRALRETGHEKAEFYSSVDDVLAIFAQLSGLEAVTSTPSSHVQKGAV